VKVPNFQQLMLPVLQSAANANGETSVSELADKIAAQLKLTEEDVEQLLPSGKQTVFKNRLNWAKSYMGKAGLVESTRRGYFRVTPRGYELLASSPKYIDVSVLSTIPEFAAWTSEERKSEVADEPQEVISQIDPEEQMAVSFTKLTKSLSSDLIERIHSFSPSFFERLIIDLLLAMGYGGGRAEMGRSLGKSGDGGIDGVIKEDELGLDVVYVQAKRYAADNAVPVREVRDFIGSLEGHRASKGVFVTTSTFPTSARDFVDRVSKRVILIDGAELARLMIRHNVGVRIKEVYEIKKIDEDYFSEQ
jgi:restriction system protein